MWNFQDIFETRKWLFISVFSICMTVPLNYKYFVLGKCKLCRHTKLLQRFLFFVFVIISTVLTLSWRRSLSHRNQSIRLKCKLMDWFLYNWGLRHERVNLRNFMKDALTYIKQVNKPSFWKIILKNRFQHF